MTEIRMCVLVCVMEREGLCLSVSPSLILFLLTENAYPARL